MLDSIYFAVSRLMVDPPVEVVIPPVFTTDNIATGINSMFTSLGPILQILPIVLFGTMAITLGPRLLRKVIKI